MDKKQLTLDDIRRAIKDFDLPYTELWDHADKMSDEAFAKCNFAEDFGMDSMDIVEITMILEKRCAISISDSSTDYVIGHNTVQAMLDKYNADLAHQY